MLLQIRRMSCLACLVLTVMLVHAQSRPATLKVFARHTTFAERSAALVGVIKSVGVRADKEAFSLKHL